jgi:putative ABC transport system permease protein
VGSLARDARYAVRTLLKQPGFTAVAVLILALGIGVNTSIFGTINALLLSAPRGVQAPAELVRVNRVDSQRSLDGTTYPDYAYFRDENRVFTGLAAYAADATPLMLRAGDAVEQIDGTFVSGNFFTVLGVRPAAGRGFVATEDGPAATERAAVISHRLWERHFGGAPTAVGQVITLNGKPFTVVGVAPAEFRGAGLDDEPVDVWAPIWSQPRLLGRAEDELRRRENYVWTWLTVVGRLKPGVTVDEARTNISALAAQLGREYKDNAQVGAALTADFALDPARRTALVSMARLVAGIALMVLLIACANLANLLLAKATGRGREIAIRQAIGADRRRVIGQMLVESLVLGVAGGAVGIGIGMLFLDALVAWLPAGIPRIAEVSIDTRVLLVTMTVSAATGIFFGLAPALQLARNAPAAVLRNDARTSTGRAPLRAILVAAELALALMLLAGAGLLIRSFVSMQRVDPGFSTDRLLTFQVRMEGPAYAEAPARIAFVDTIVERLKTLPGVTDAAAGSNAPITGRGTGAWFNMLARPWPAGTTPPGIPYRIITPEYFKTMQIPLVRGRLLTDADGPAGTPSVLISESVAKRFWGADAARSIGSEIYMGAPDNKLFERATIVGIVKDVKLAGLGNPLTDAVYGLNTLMPWWRNFTFAVRTSGDPTSLAPSVRQIVRAADPRLAITGLQAMTDIMSTSLAPARASMLLLALFAGVAIVMAAVGVFGVMSYTVNLRAREMGIRMALGARPSEVRRMVVADGMRQAAIGVALGVAGAIWVTRAMTSLLFQVRPGDPMTLVTAAVLLLATAALACYVPARRATRVDPLIVLRTE